jgi:hypothetical protein
MIFLQGEVPKPRDDHTLSVIGDSSIIIFGGFINGSRVNDIYKGEVSATQITWSCLADSQQVDLKNP